MSKPKVAFFDFTSCEGCQLSILNLETELLELLDIVDIVEFREAMSEKSDTYDIAVIEGSFSRDKDLKRLKKIRETAGVVIALGACAHIGGINSLRNNQTREDVQRIVYPDNPALYETNKKAMPISTAIKVDAFVPGCPVDVGEFVKVVKNLVLGKDPALPTYPVCVECKMNENICVYELGKTCLGPVVRAGCNAICISSGGVCIGCRGLIPNPNINSQKDIMEKYGLDMDLIIDSMNLFMTEENKEV
ncbi:MAG: hypothetical protein KAR21_02845 [Spirochaetales bacterium]|nr:hypothetical protein [Spirochaetales bacterium]